MLHPLPASVRGATHVRIDEVVFNTQTRALYVRGMFGSVDPKGNFVPDPALAPTTRVFQGEEYLVTVGPLVPPFRDSVIPLVDAAGWVG